MPSVQCIEVDFINVFLSIKSEFWHLPHLNSPSPKYMRQ